MEVKNTKPSHRKHQSFYLMRRSDEFSFNTPSKTSIRNPALSAHKKRPAPSLTHRPSNSLSTSKVFENRRSVNTIEKSLTRQDMMDAMGGEEASIKNSLEKYIKLIREKGSVKHNRINRELKSLHEKAKGRQIES
jgi:hypothetical protein